MKKNIIIWISILIGFLTITACGDPDITAAINHFDLKVVVQGYLYPNKDINILVTKNFPLEQNSTFNVFDLILENASVKLTDIAANQTYSLVYDPATLTYIYSDSNLIDYNKTYRLDVDASIDDQRFIASSSTTVPQKGVKIDKEKSVLGPLTYRAKDKNNNLQHIEIAFKRSTGIGFYVIAIEALDASTSTYIYDNPYNDNDENDVNFFFDDLKYSIEWAQNLPLNNNQEPIISRQEIQWIKIQFYGRYRAIMYAADQNFKDFFLTHSITQGMDGNLMQPLYHFTGDGIGVFGSAITDTVYFEISR